jgi:ubiquinone/menaquinone biosynthesis C-methylase UbiE
MGHRRSNVERNRWVVTLLDVRPGDRVLEVGFGPGVALAELARRAVSGYVHGIDHSPVMVSQARRRNAAAIRSGRMDLSLGSVERLPEFSEPFDKIMAVNSMGFWPEPVTRLEELRRCLWPGGLVAVAVQPRCPGADATTSERAADDIAATVEAAGFGDLRVERMDLHPPVVCVIGTKPAL